jgi:hypothetical protein
MRRALSRELELGLVERPARWMGAPRTAGVPNAVVDASPTSRAT